MSTRKRPSEGLESKPDAVRDSDAPFDPLTAPLASELESDEDIFGGGPKSLHQGSIGVRTRTQEDTYSTKPIPAPAKRPVRRRPIRRSKATIKHIDPLSVLKISLFFYGCMFVLWLFFAAFLYWVAIELGVIDAYDDFRRGYEMWPHANITFFVVEKWAIIIGLIFLVLGSIMNAFLAFIYNIASDALGGVQVTLLDRDA